MRVYLVLATREARERIPAPAFRAARRAIHEAFPVPPDVVKAVEWTAPGGRVALLGWTNEPEHELLPETVISGGAWRLGYCGYLAEPKRDVDLLLARDDLAGTAAELGGVFSIFRAGTEGVEAATAMARVCPVYHAEARGLRVIGSRALLVHLVAQAVRTDREDPEVDIDVEALHPLVRHGFYANDDTPFRGVHALPAGSLIRAIPGEPTVVRQQPSTPARETPRDDRGRRELVRPLAEALVASAAPLARHRDPVALALSGGRDSRLMAAVLRSAGVAFTATTHGFADDPDVVLGTRVAQALRIEHEVELTVPQERKDFVDVQHPFSRTHDIIRMCEGMNSAYESVNRYRPYELAPRTSGSGGETLRGGFLYDQDDVSDEGLQKRVRLIFHAAERFMTSAANERAAAEHRPWAERARSDGFDVLDKLYLHYRTGRWIVGSHTATLMNTPYYHPFFDNRVVRAVLALSAEWRRSEYPFHLLLQELAPPLAVIPPEGKRWRFDRGRGPLLSGRRAWRARAPLTAKGGTSGFNWRVSFDQSFRDLLQEQILDGPEALFDIVDRDAYTTLLRDSPGRWTKQIWHVYTLSVLLSQEWRRPAPALPSVRIPIPG
ncbi:asparagine synthase-related protein [Actinomadura litoris]|uniref:asparagine synthase-related protein n=1 Tax=Actinomadura litoris TaxID=2678616 RepID=UPI001FA79007|nr:asparagine synthase-related protein [Actinomadura litoris]